MRSPWDDTEALWVDDVTEWALLAALFLRKIGIPITSNNNFLEMRKILTYLVLVNRRERLRIYLSILC